MKNKKINNPILTNSISRICQLIEVLNLLIPNIQIAIALIDKKDSRKLVVITRVLSLIVSSLSKICTIYGTNSNAEGDDQ